jgi:hypothetical protein
VPKTAISSLKEVVGQAFFVVNSWGKNEESKNINAYCGS